MHQDISTPENLAQFFHETYERLAPDFGYKTRDESAVPWKNVPGPNRDLMVAVCAEVIKMMTSDPARVEYLLMDPGKPLESAEVIPWDEMCCCCGGQMSGWLTRNNDFPEGMVTDQDPAVCLKCGWMSTWVVDDSYGQPTATMTGERWPDPEQWLRSHPPDADALAWLRSGWSSDVQEDKG